MPSSNSRSLFGPLRDSAAYRYPPDLPDEDRPSYDLPTEVISQIVAFNSDNKKLLLKYSVVSRAWRRACLPWICRKADLETRRHFQRWNALVKSSPDTANFVRRVRFVPVTWKAKAIIGPSALKDIPSLPVMPAAKELKWAPFFRFLKCAVPITPLITRFLRCFPSLRRIEIHSAFLDIRSLECFIGHCGPVKELVLNVAFEHEPLKNGNRNNQAASQHLDISGFDLTSLEHLTIESNGYFRSEWVVDSLFANSKPQRLRSLTIETFLGELFNMDCYPLTSLFASSLEHLTLTTPQRQHPSGLTDPILEPLPALRILTLIVGTTFIPLKQTKLEEFLSHLQAESLVVLELKFRGIKRPYEVTKRLRRLGWKQLCALALKQFPKLEKLVLWFASEEYIPQRRRTELLEEVEINVPNSYLGGKEVAVSWSVESRYAKPCDSDLEEYDSEFDSDDEYGQSESESNE
ncbi:hypothetical protein V5O48_002538 [Marasmius crinis-equi]|uniref:F-box domain-containing protein n=1 Tax=Marasmius crinis-equi TaxID=585013 RepID=A0ABR3FVI4_9AGAR